MTVIPITIRNLGPEDVHILDRVRAGTFDHPVDPARAFAFLATRVNELVVAITEGEVVGFASGTVIMHPDKPSQFFINEVGVHADVRRQGIGRRLVDRLRDLARDRGCEGIWLATEADNAPACGLYRALDGHETDRVVVFDWDKPER